MSEQTKPVPKKKRLTRRRIIFLAVIFAVVCARLIWGVYAQSVLDSELQAIAVRGEPVSWSGLAPPPISDEQNAAELYKKAAGISEAAEKSSRLYRQGYKNLEEDCRSYHMMADLLQHADFRRTHEEDVKEILTLNREALDLARKARSLPDADWKVNFEIPFYDRDLNTFSGQKTFSKVLLLAAVDAHDKGDDASAIEFILDVLAQGRTVRSVPTYLAYLVATAIEAHAIEMVERITPRLRDRKHTRILINAFLDEKTVCEEFVLMHIGERIEEYNYCENYRQGMFWNNDKRAWERHSNFWIMRACVGPAQILDEVRVLRHMNVYVKAAKAENYPKAMETYWTGVKRPSEAEASTVTNIFFRPFSWKQSFVGEHGESYFNIYFQLLASRRMAAVALAMRLYELDHSRRPHKLEDLVEKYIPFIPDDPFDGSGGKIRYLPGGEVPLLYCIGSDGKDNGGAFAIYKEDWRKGCAYSDDYLFFLNGNRPVGKPAIRDTETQPTTSPATTN